MRILPGLQAIDTIVDPSARAGVFIQTAKAAYAFAEREGIAAVFGFPNAAAAPGWFRHLGWTRVGSSAFPDQAASHRVLSREKSLVMRCQSTCLFRLSERLRGQRWQSTTLTKPWTLSLEAFAEATGVAVDRTHDYLNWRLFNDPTAKYEARAVFDGFYDVLL